jgi:hypothetical protein
MALEAISTEFQSKRRKTEELLLMSPRELDAYGAWQEDLQMRVDAITNALRERHRA